jgi:hypothetical protein
MRNYNSVLPLSHEEVPRMDGWMGPRFSFYFIFELLLYFATWYFVL